VVDEKLKNEYTFLKEKDILDESYINGLQTDQQKEIAHQINRRTEFQVLSTEYESE
jgi:peptidoglycan-associated lipoprotein